MCAKDDQQTWFLCLTFSELGSRRYPHGAERLIFVSEFRTGREDSFDCNVRSIGGQAIHAIGVKSAHLAAFEAARSGIFRV